MSHVTRHKNVVLILAREFATRLATPVFVADADGRLVFYNEPAEEVLGRTFAEAGEMAAEEWETLFSVADLEGNPLPLDRMPGGMALLERRPAHTAIRIRALDGIERVISVTGLPLFARAEEFVGVVVIFWEEPEAPGQ